MSSTLEHGLTPAATIVDIVRGNSITREEAIEFVAKWAAAHRAAAAAEHGDQLLAIINPERVVR